MNVLGKLAALGIAAGFILALVAAEAQSADKTAVRITKLEIARGGGNTAAIHFELDGYTDVTVRVLDRAGNVVRHLASVVLGKNAPLPLQKETLHQVIVWDGKDDDGKPVTGATVQVRAGLNAKFGSFIGWDPTGLIGRARAWR